MGTASGRPDKPDERLPAPGFRSLCLGFGAATKKLRGHLVLLGSHRLHDMRTFCRKTRCTFLSAARPQYIASPSNSPRNLLRRQAATRQANKAPSAAQWHTFAIFKAYACALS